MAAALKRSASSSSTTDEAAAVAVVSDNRTIQRKLAKKVGSSTASTSAKSTTSVQTTLNFGSKGPLLKKPKLSSPVAGLSTTTEAILASNPELEADFKKYFPSLPLENLPLLELELRTMARDWLEVFGKEMEKKSFLSLKKFLLKEQASHKIYPPANEIYSFTHLTPLNSIRLVIIGQDPYHQPSQAHGLAFSVKKGVQVPPSLRNIYKEIAAEYPGFVPPKHGDLTSLARQGVLLLNTSLSVRDSMAASHSKQGWEDFTLAIISWLGQSSVVVNKSSSAADAGTEAKMHGKVFLAWGKWAEKCTEGVNLKSHLVLKSAHPSPLSASRGFLGNNHFVDANKWLKATHGEDAVINWTDI